MNSDDPFGFNGDGQASALGGGGGGRASDILKLYCTSSAGISLAV